MPASVNGHRDARGKRSGGHDARFGEKTGNQPVLEKDGIYADVSVIVKYGYNVPELAYRIQQSVKQNVENMTKYKVAKVDVHIQDVVFPAPTPPETQSEEESGAEDSDSTEA